MNKKTIWSAVIVVIIIIILVVAQTGKKSSGTLRVGVISALTGSASYIGESNMKGAEIGKMKALQDHPGLAMEMYHEDSAFTPQGGINAYNKLRSTNAVNAIVTMASNVSIAVEPLALKDNVLDIAASTLAAKFTTPDDLSFRLTSKADTEAGTAIQYLASKKLSKLGILYMNNEIGISLNDALKKATEGSSVTVVASEAFPADAIDFKTLLLKMKSAGVDSIYLAALASHSAVILTQANALQVPVSFVSYRAAEDPILVKNAGAFAEHLVYTNAYDSNSASAANTEFQKLYQEKYHEKPNGYAAEAYEAVRLIADAYAKCGSTLDGERAVSCTKSLLFSVKDRPSLFGSLSFDMNGDVSYPFFMKTVRNGEFVRVE